MRISDWSSDVCSSDLHLLGPVLDGFAGEGEVCLFERSRGGGQLVEGDTVFGGEVADPRGGQAMDVQRLGARGDDLHAPSCEGEIGRASCRERVCQYV